MASDVALRMDQIAIAFLWDQWSQLGLSGAPASDDIWVMDPEALLLLTLRMGPSDPRLFDEVLDWLCANGRWISTKRLRNLAAGIERDERLADAVLAWVGVHESSLQLWKGAPRGATQRAKKEELEPLGDLYVGEPDVSFAEWGFAWPGAKRSHKSQHVDTERPVALAFRLRALLGVGARAEVVRYLYSIAPKEAPVAEIAAAAAFGKRNANNTLRDLATAKTVRRTTVGNEHRYGLFADRWDHLLGAGAPEYRPNHVAWIPLLSSVARFAEWSATHRAAEKSAYMLASDARQLIDELRPSLEAAGIALPSGPGVIGEDYFPAFELLTQQIATALGVEPSGTS
jgi:hypothetical protein